MLFYWHFDMIIAFIAIFVFVMAESEYNAVKWELKLDKYRAEDLLVGEMGTRSVDQRLFLAGLEPKHSYLLIDKHQQIVGWLDAEKVRQDPEAGPLDRLGKWLEPSTSSIAAEQSLLSAVHKMRQDRIDSIAITKDQQIIGHLTLDRIEALANDKNIPNG